MIVAEISDYNCQSWTGLKASKSSCTVWRHQSFARCELCVLSSLKF